jgi:predicted RNA binding protein YcfA (HicA-like mRNA interferase family)
MPKLGVFSGWEICRILEQRGFRNVRQRGSHVVMQKQSEGSTITVPVPMHAEIRIGTLMSIIRQSQVERSAFEKQG